jgi:hypothetical protein
VIQESPLSLAGLRYARDAVIRMKQNDVVRPYILKQRPSEVQARRALILAGDIYRSSQEAQEKRLVNLHGSDALHSAPSDYLLSGVASSNGYLELVSLNLWREAADYIQFQHRLAGSSKRTHVEAWLQAERLLCRPVYQRFMRNYFGLLFAFLVTQNSWPTRMQNRIEIVYIIFAGYLAAHIKIYPDLKMALRRAYPELPPTDAILCELPGQAVLESRLSAGSNFPLDTIPARAAESIRSYYPGPNYEYPVDDVLSAEAQADPFEIVSKCETVRACLNSFTPQQRRVALLKADGYQRREIAEILNVAEESVKEHISRFQHKAKRMQLARN